MPVPTGLEIHNRCHLCCVSCHCVHLWPLQILPIVRTLSPIGFTALTMRRSGMSPKVVSRWAGDCWLQEGCSLCVVIYLHTRWWPVATSAGSVPATGATRAIGTVCSGGKLFCFCNLWKVVFDFDIWLCAARYFLCSTRYFLCSTRYFLCANVTSCVLHVTSCVLHVTSCVLMLLPVFYTLLSVLCVNSCVLHITSCVLHATSCVLHVTSCFSLQNASAYFLFYTSVNFKHPRSGTLAWSQFHTTVVIIRG